MRGNIIDAHIHLDDYEDCEQKRIIESMDQYQINGLITVSNHLQSAKHNLALSRKYNGIYPAFGFHPEQTLPKEKEIQELIDFIIEHQNEMVAVGEVGLPYYLRKKENIQLEDYIELLEEFIKLAKKLNKPIVLHAIYDDAPLVCTLLEKYSIEKAQFHWFKGDMKTLERMIENGYCISVTPDVLYEKEIQDIVKMYPITQIMVETDGPWRFKGPFHSLITHPKMIHESINEIAHLKSIDLEFVYEQMYETTREFFMLR